MTASTSVDPSADAVAWSAVVLREDEPDDRARLAELSADPGVVVLDHSDRVQHELATLTPELSPADGPNPDGGSGTPGDAPWPRFPGRSPFGGYGWTEIATRSPRPNRIASPD